MPTDAPDKARVIALPPLIVIAILALGLLIHFIWPMTLLPYTVLSGLVHS
jgi:hypothetical protein